LSAGNAPGCNSATGRGKAIAKARHCLDFGRTADDERVSIQPTLQCKTNEAAISTAMSGWGLTRVLHYQVGRALLDGDLKVVLSDYEEPPLPIYVFFPEGRHLPAKVRAFTEIAVSRLRANRLLN
jgi:DNA-binding transcriptional LysR family regulator